MSISSQPKPHDEGSQAPDASEVDSVEASVSGMTSSSEAVPLSALATPKKAKKSVNKQKEDASNTKEDVNKPNDIVTLVLDHSDPDPEKHVQLNIPLSVIKQNVVSHFRYLVFCAVYVTGIKVGHLSLTQGGEPPAEPVQLLANQKWWWVVPDGVVPIGDAAVNLSVGSSRPSRNHSGNTHNRTDSFKERVKRRDGRCVFTGLEEDQCSALHIIPHHVSDTYLQDIFRIRTFCEAGEVDHSTLSVDDIRNGLFVNANVRVAFDGANLGIIATPNEVLQDSDLHPEVDFKKDRRPGMTSAPPKRFTLHWLRVPDKNRQEIARNNVAARFSAWQIENGSTSSGRNPKMCPIYPHPDLINYAYACQLVRKFGTAPTLSAFKTRPVMPRRPELSHGSSSTEFRREYNVRGDRADVPNKLAVGRKEPGAGQSGQTQASGQQSGGATLQDLCLTSPADNDDVEPPSEQHPIRRSKFGEDGLMSAEEFMYQLHMSRPPLVKEPEPDLTRIGQWREEVPKSGMKEPMIVWEDGDIPSESGMNEPMVVWEDEDISL